MGSLGERIQLLLKQSDYTQKELAQMIGVTESAMSRYIKNEREPKTEIIANIATALNTTSDYLISGKDKEEDFADIYRLVARSASNMSTEEKFKLMRLLTEE